jgi:hypothetical protein
MQPRRRIECALRMLRLMMGVTPTYPALDVAAVGSASPGQPAAVLAVFALS